MKVKPFYQTIALVDNYSLHFYSSKKFKTYVLTKPLSFGFNYELKPLKRLKGLDVYLFGQGLLFNQDLLAEYKLNIPPIDGRTLFWNIGAGVNH